VSQAVIDEEIQSLDSGVPAAFAIKGEYHGSVG
jgi:hypothetical protein